MPERYCGISLYKYLAGGSPRCTISDRVASDEFRFCNAEGERELDDLKAIVQDL